MRELGAVLLGNGLLVLAGNGALRVAGFRAGLRDLPWSLAVAYLAGAAAVGVVGSVVLVAGLSLALWQLVGLCLALAAARLVPGGARPALGPRLAGPLRLLPAATLATLLVLAIDFAVQPLWTEDGWAIWAAKARSFVQLGGLDSAFLSSASVYNADYPLVVPVLETVTLRFAGSESEFVPLQLGLLFLALPFALAALLRARARPVVLWPVAFGLAIAPALQVQAASAVGDVPLAAFFAPAGVCGWLWLERGETRLLALSGLFAAAAAGTKVEGRVFALVLALALGAAAYRRRRGLRPLALASLAAAATTLPWILWARANDVPSAYEDAGGIDLGRSLRLPERIPDAALSVLREIVDPSSWLALTALVGVAVVLALRAPAGRQAALFTLAVTLPSLASLVVVYWLTPLDFDYHVATSVRRVVVAPVVFAAAMTPILLGAAWRDQPPR